MEHIFETHAHYDDEWFHEDREKLLESLPDNGIETVVNIAASLDSIPTTIALAEKYDYIYVGVISHERGIDVLLKNYVKNVTPEKTLLLVGNYEQSLYDIYSSPNIIFTGKVCKSQVYDLLMQSKTGISYIPKGMPYDIQTSTKLLEYAWCGLDIIANDSKSNILTANRIGYTCKPLSNSFLDLEINKTKNVNVYAKISWKKIICDSGILTFLEKY